MALEASKESALATLERTVVRAGQRWKHYKTGGMYDIIEIGINEASYEPSVVYRSHDGVVWIRALSVFLGRAKQGDTLVPRFSLIQG